MLILMGVLIHLQHCADITVSTMEITSITTFLSRPCFIIMFDLPNIQITMN